VIESQNEGLKGLCRCKAAALRLTDLIFLLRKRLRQSVEISMCRKYMAVKTKSLSDRKRREGMIANAFVAGRNVDGKVRWGNSHQSLLIGTLRLHQKCECLMCRAEYRSGILGYRGSVADTSVLSQGWWSFVLSATRDGGDRVRW
jgi:hypothetical protein